MFFEHELKYTFTKMIGCIFFKNCESHHLQKRYFDYTKKKSSRNIHSQNKLKVDQRAIKISDFFILFIFFANEPEIDRNPINRVIDEELSFK